MEVGKVYHYYIFYITAYKKIGLSYMYQMVSITIEIRKGKG